jgi:bacteriocin biosynthesis cyclodehydratase domain-containing protein
MRPILRPGTHVLRRGSAELQLGLDPRTALVLPDTAAVRAGLDVVTDPGSNHADAAAARPTVDLLAEQGLLLDEADVLPLLAGDLPAPLTSALARAPGGRAADAHRARARARFEVRGFGHAAGTDLRERFVALAATAGLHEAAPRAAGAPDCGVLVGVGEPDRDLLDRWTRAGTPHLLVRLTEGRAVVGPFVVPGRTACLRCLDAHCTDADPAWPLLVRQYATASARDRADGVPEPVDPLLAALALAWAAGDLASYVDGARPSSWSATVEVHPRTTRIDTRTWLRHPSCGCSWG